MMDRYQRAEKPRQETPIIDNEIRITSQGKIRNYITYATTLLHKNEGSAQIIIKATGKAINKAVTVAEIIKRRIAGLHQIITIGSIDITDSWEPLEQGLLPFQTTRPVSMITITLSTSTTDVDTNSPGYQSPLPVDQVRPLGEGSPSSGRGHAVADANLEKPKRRGRGRGRRGRGYRSDEQSMKESEWPNMEQANDNLSEWPNMEQANDEGASEWPNMEQANDKGAFEWLNMEQANDKEASEWPNMEQANDKGVSEWPNMEQANDKGASEWLNMEQANDKEGDAQYGWEEVQEQLQIFQPWGGVSEQCNHYLQLSDVFDSKENVIWWVDTIEGLVAATSYFKSAEVKVVGMDCEWRPNYVKGEDPNQVSILQIATEKKVLIFDLIGLFETEPDALDTCLKVVFHSPNILKLGYDFHHDLEHLFESYTDLECFHFCDGILDLQKVNGSAKGGLSGLAKNLLGSDLNKKRRMSNWERRPLTHSQLKYAALDAAVLIAIFNILCCEPSSHGSAGMQHTSHWKSLVTCWTNAKYKRVPAVFCLKADLAGASLGDELADNQKGSYRLLSES